MDGRDLRAQFPAAELTFNVEQLRIMKRFGVTMSFSDGEVLIEAGAPGPKFYVVQSGEVTVIEFSKGSPQIVWKAGPGELLGEVGFLSGTASNLSRIARGDVEALEISAENLRRVIDEEVELGNTILAALIARTRIMRDLNLSPLRVVGSRYSADAFRIREFLTKNRVAFAWIDTESDPDVDQLLKHLAIKEEETPVVACGVDWTLRNPGNRDLATRLGVLTAPKGVVYDLAIVGGGPAGLTAAVYGASEGLSTLVLERAGPGGQAGTSSRIENYPGFPMGLSGEELAARITLQAQKFGAQISTPCEVRTLAFDNGYPVLRVDDGTSLSARCVMIATGAAYRRLPIEGGDRFDGLGVYYAATPMEAQACTNADVVVVGGANSAGQAAVFLAERARRVFLAIRGDDLNKGMSRYLARRIEQTANVEILFNTDIAALLGARHLEDVEFRNNRTGMVRRVQTNAVFTFIGARPHTDWLPSEIEIDQSGFIKTGPAVTRWAGSGNRSPYFLETSMPGVFASGDVRQGSMKRVASAVGEGAMVVAFVHDYLRSA